MTSPSTKRLVFARYARRGLATSALSLANLTACNPSKDHKPFQETHSQQVAQQTSHTNEKECCFGLNDCKGQGGCAVPENHDCRGKNECKGKGGCNMHCPQ